MRINIWEPMTSKKRQERWDCVGMRMDDDDKVKTVIDMGVSGRRSVRRQMSDGKTGSRMIWGNLSRYRMEVMDLCYWPDPPENCQLNV